MASRVSVASGWSRSARTMARAKDQFVQKAADLVGHVGRRRADQGQGPPVGLFPGPVGIAQVLFRLAAVGDVGQDAHNRVGRPAKVRSITLPRASIQRHFPESVRKRNSCSNRCVSPDRCLSRASEKPSRSSGWTMPNQSSRPDGRGRSLGRATEQVVKPGTEEQFVGDRIPIPHGHITAYQRQVGSDFY